MALVDRSAGRQVFQLLYRLRNELKVAVLREWATADPEAMLGYLEGLDETERSQATSAVLTAIMMPITSNTARSNDDAMLKCDVVPQQCVEQRAGCDAERDEDRADEKPRRRQRPAGTAARHERHQQRRGAVPERREVGREPGRQRAGPTM